MIGSFRGEYKWLSNFYSSIVWFDGIDYPTAEHAYQAAKTNSIAERLKIRSLKTPGEAKRFGKFVGLRMNWMKVKLEVMEVIIRQKFSREPLRTKLLETGNEEIVEGNDWGDTYWGYCDGVGENNLGKIIMKVRDELRRS